MTEETPSRPYFKDLIDSKPSKAITAMLDGLERLDKSDNFKVTMGTFGQVQHLEEGEVCYGCAATCAILELLPEDPMDYVVRRCSVNFSRPYDYESGPDMLDFLTFEDVIDSLRLGIPRRLLDYCGLSYGDIKTVHKLPSYAAAKENPLTTMNWRYRVSFFRKLAEDLEKLGL